MMTEYPLVQVHNCLCKSVFEFRSRFRMCKMLKMTMLNWRILVVKDSSRVREKYSPTYIEKYVKNSIISVSILSGRIWPKFIVK